MPTCGICESQDQGRFLPSVFEPAERHMCRASLFRELLPAGGVVSESTVGS